MALKVLPPEMAENAERRARFEREAKAVAALDHPNIVTIHSVEEAEGVHFYTMQLVKGKTLTELIPKKGIPLSKFFDIAIPLADAVRKVEAVVGDFSPSAVIFDMRELRYTWGEAIAGIIIPILLRKDKPTRSCLIAKGSTARRIADLMKGSVLGDGGPLFSSLEEAVGFAVSTPVFHPLNQTN